MATLDPFCSLRRLAEDVQQCVDGLLAVDSTSARQAGFSEFERAYELDSIGASLESSYNRIRTLRHRIWAAKAFEHNRTAAINTLPAELLSMIFKMTQGDRSVPIADRRFWWNSSSWGPGHAEDGENPGAWLRITVVCQHWRQVASNNPFLWNTIAFNATGYPPESVEHQLSWLRRCGNAHLDVHILDFTKIDPRIVEELATRSSQMRYLDIRGVPNLDSLSIFEHTAPWLECLSIDALCVSAQANRLPVMFGNSTPRLRGLSTTDVDTFLGSSPAFNNLSHIILSGHLLLTPTVVRAMIQANPLVKTLILRSCHSHGDTENLEIPQSLESASRTPLQLPLLQELSFWKCDGEFMSDVLACIELPSSTGVTMTCDSWTLEEPLESIFTTETRPHIMQLLEVQALSVGIEPPRGGACVLGVNNASVISIFHCDSPQPAYPTTISTVFSLERLLELHIKGTQWLKNDNNVPHQWITLFTRLPSLNKLVLEDASEAWIRALRGIRDEAIGDNSHRPLLMPSLHSLVLILSDPDSHAQVFVHELKSLVEERQHYGVRIPHLHVSCYGPFEGALPVYTELHDERQGIEIFVDELELEMSTTGSYPPLDIPPTSQAFIAAACR